MELTDVIARGRVLMSGGKLLVKGTFRPENRCQVPRFQFPAGPGVQIGASPRRGRHIFLNYREVDIPSKSEARTWHRFIPDIGGTRQGFPFIFRRSPFEQDGGIRLRAAKRTQAIISGISHLAHFS